MQSKDPGTDTATSAYVPVPLLEKALTACFAARRDLVDLSSNFRPADVASSAACREACAVHAAPSAAGAAAGGWSGCSAGDGGGGPGGPGGPGGRAVAPSGPQLPTPTSWAQDSDDACSVASARSVANLELVGLSLQACS